MRTALVIGGTGQSGPHLVEGLLARGYEVVVLHGGFHEVHFSQEIEHIHADAHFVEPLEDALGGRTFDLALCTYGRTRIVADVLRGKTPRLITVSGMPIYAWSDPNRAGWGDLGLTAASETSPLQVPPGGSRLGEMVWKTEEALMEAHHAGHYEVTILRFPAIYGPRAVNGRDWSIVKRALDRRPSFIVAHGGLRLRTSAFVENAAQAVLLAVDKPRESAGQAYNVGDASAFVTQGQRIAFIGRELDHQFELVSLPEAVAESLYPGEWGYHRVADTTKIRTELGYEDVVDTATAIRLTVEWWVRNQPTAEQSAKWPDRFDYALEDELVHGYKSLVGPYLEGLRLPENSRKHPFRHPKKEGENWSSAAAERLSAGPSAPFPYALWTGNERARPPGDPSAAGG